MADAQDGSSGSSIVAEHGSILAAFVEELESPNLLRRITRDADGCPPVVMSPEDVPEGAAAAEPEKHGKENPAPTAQRDADAAAANNNDAIEIQGILNVLEDHAPDFDRDQFFENFRRRLRELDLLDDDFFDLDDQVHPESHPPLYPVGEAKYASCEICLEWKNLNLRPCCHLPVCAECMAQYANTQISQAIVKVECLNNVCERYVHREEVISLLEPENKEKFYRFLVDANKEPHIKTCPRCSHISQVDQDLVKTFRQLRAGHRVECPACELEWCFPCQAPWHEGLSCREFQKGDKLLNAWAKEHHYGQANAQKCPKCRVFIQRSSGCDHMTCIKCKTDFCYRCGERFIEIRFIGDHYSKLSILGCKYRLKPNNPAQRRLIRGAVFGSKLVAAPLVAGLAIGAGAVLMGVGILALPFYGSYKLHRRITQKKRAKRQKEAIAEFRRKAGLEMQFRHSGDPYLENWMHMQELGLDMSQMYQGATTFPAEDAESCPTARHLAEFDISQLDHSKSESWFSESDDTWDSESEAEQGNVTEVKVITEKFDLDSLERERKRSGGSGESAQRDQEEDMEQLGRETPPNEAAESAAAAAALALPEETSVETSDDAVSACSAKPEESPEIWEAVSEANMVREIKVTKEADGERTMCIYRL